jgi:hypothetical protein
MYLDMQQFQPLSNPSKWAFGSSLAWPSWC